MSQWLPSSGQQWIVQLVVIAILGVVARGYFTASAEARLLDDQLQASQDTTAMLTDSLVVVRETSDSLIAQTEIHAVQDSIAIAEVRDSVISAVGNTDAQLAAAREVARGMPVVQAALAAVTHELELEREAISEERAVSASALFASQQRERTLGNQLVTERTASQAVIDGLRMDLSISMQESDAWERAASPGALTQIWRQGRAAVVVGILVFAIASN